MVGGGYRVPENSGHQNITPGNKSYISATNNWNLAKLNKHLKSYPMQYMLRFGETSLTNFAFLWGLIVSDIGCSRQICGLVSEVLCHQCGWLTV